MVDSVVSSREIYEDNAGDFPCFKAIFYVLGEVQHLGSTRFSGAEASLLRYQDVFDNGRQAVQYQLGPLGAHTVCRGDTKGKLV